MFSHEGGVFLVQSDCFLMGEVFFWDKVKLLSFVGGVFLVQSEAVLSLGRCPFWGAVV